MHELWNQRNTEPHHGQLNRVLRIYSKNLGHYTRAIHAHSVLSSFLSLITTHIEELLSFSGNPQLDGDRLYPPTICKLNYTIYLPSHNSTSVLNYMYIILFYNYRLLATILNEALNYYSSHKKKKSTMVTHVHI